MTGNSEIRFLSHAEGSLAELDTQLMLAIELGYCRASDAEGSTAKVAELQKIMASLRGKLAARLETIHQPLATRHQPLIR